MRPRPCESRRMFTGITGMVVADVPPGKGGCNIDGGGGAAGLLVVALLVLFARRRGR